MSLRRALVATVAFSFACSSPPAEPVDSGPADVGPVDVGVDAGPPPPTDAPLKGPFVMQPTTTSVVVRWESQLSPTRVEVEYQPEAGGTTETATGTARETVTQLEYGVGSTFVSEPDVPGTYFVSEVALTGLTPATCYTYAIGGYPDDAGRFCTMHEATDHTTPIVFYAIGDTSPGIMNTLRILAHVDPSTTEFSVHVGDLQYYSTLIESQQLWFDLMHPMLRANAFLPCFGNHEHERDFEQEDIYDRLFDHPGGSTGEETTYWYEYETGGVHFFSLDTEDPIDAGSPQNDWFDAAITAAEATPGYRFSIVYFHRPIYGVASYTPNLRNRAAIEAIITAHRVPLVLAGHMHNYERFQIDDITHVTTGSGGFSDAASTLDAAAMDFPEDAARRVASGAFFEAMIVEIVPDPATPGGDLIQARTVDDMGMARDTFEIQVPPPP